MLTPLVVDPSHPFPFLSNLSQSLGILLKDPDSGETRFARVKVPGHVPAWLRLETFEPNANVTGAKLRFVRLIDLIRANLASLFPEMHVVDVMPFRVTRTAEVEDDEEDVEGSLIEHVVEELRQRRMEKVVRLEYEPPGSAAQLALLTDRLDLDDLHVYEARAELDFTGLLPIAALPRPELRDHPWEPVVPAEFADGDGSVFSIIRAGDVLVHHPYESFDATTARFIRSACEDPKVLAIKMTVYRIGSDTPFINSLIRAAEAGKQVACLVEVTARFDEQQNLHWARVLDEVGVHVVYGILGLKTHTKTTLVVRNEADGIRCYAHIGTGNYHVKTARLYADLGLLTCDPVLTADVVELFHALTGGSKKRTYTKLLVAPVNMRERFLALIDREIVHCQAGRPARIIAKLNQLEDRSICEALVGASQAGVAIDLIVRGFCVLPPGVPGVTEHVHVISVIGRFLEHSRIYYFQNGAADPLQGEYFIGSADWMERNLSRRVEAIAPIEAPALRQRLWHILQTSLDDRRQAWDMHADGTYVQRTPGPNDSPEGPASLGTQATLMAEAIRSRGSGRGIATLRTRYAKVHHHGRAGLRQGHAGQDARHGLRPRSHQRRRCFSLAHPKPYQAGGPHSPARYRRRNGARRHRRGSGQGAPGPARLELRLHSRRLPAQLAPGRVLPGELRHQRRHSDRRAGPGRSATHRESTPVLRSAAWITT